MLAQSSPGKGGKLVFFSRGGGEKVLQKAGDVEGFDVKFKGIRVFLAPRVVRLSRVLFVSICARRNHFVDGVIVCRVANLNNRNALF